MGMSMNINVEVKIPPLLGKLVGGASTIRSQGETLRHLLENLDKQFPGFKWHIVSKQGKLHDYIIIFLNEEDIHYLNQLETPLKNGDVINILVVLSGG